MNVSHAPMSPMVANHARVNTIAQIVRDDSPVLKFFKEFKLATVKTFNATTVLIKNEKLAITALFFVTLGLLPLWAALVFGMAGIARLAFSAAALRSQIEQSNRVLNAVSIGAIQERRLIVQERDALRLQVGRFEIDLNERTQERDQALDQLRSAEQGVVFYRDAGSRIERENVVMREQIYMLRGVSKRLAERNAVIEQQLHAVRAQRDDLKKVVFQRLAKN